MARLLTQAAHAPQPLSDVPLRLRRTKSLLRKVSKTLFAKGALPERLLRFGCKNSESVLLPRLDQKAERSY